MKSALDGGNKTEISRVARNDRSGCLHDLRQIQATRHRPIRNENLNHAPSVRSFPYVIWLYLFPPRTRHILDRDVLARLRFKSKSRWIGLFVRSLSNQVGRLSGYKKWVEGVLPVFLTLARFFKARVRPP